jgi:hypothetical protein
MKFEKWIFFVAAVTCSVTASSPATIAAESSGKISILYDAFGADPTMTKDWGFSALVEVAGKRILFDTGDNAEIFGKNVRAKGVDLTAPRFCRSLPSSLRSYGRIELCPECEPEGQNLRTQGRIRHIWFVASVDLLSQG